MRVCLASRLRTDAARLIESRNGLLKDALAYVGVLEARPRAYEDRDGSLRSSLFPRAILDTERLCRDDRGPLSGLCSYPTLELSRLVISAFRKGHSRLVDVGLLQSDSVIGTIVEVLLR